MMIRSGIFALALTASLGLALPSYAQVTDQTDKSEEDWRQSRKKSGTSDIYRTPDTWSTGSGSIDITPLTPVERLPSDSRRHLMRERAKAIAESDDGDISDAEYVPSEAAKTDEALAREEQEAWDIIVTDAQGGSGEGTSQGGPNKVAVVGQGNGSASSGSRGGSTRTLQEIMDAIKNGETAGGDGGQSDSGQSNSGQSDSGNATGSGQAGQAGQGNADGSDGQSGADGASGDSRSNGQNSGQGQADGEATDGNGDADGSDGQSGAEGSSSGDAGDGDSADSGDAGSSSSRTQEPMSPLERIRRTREEGAAEGSKRSASDYLGKSDN